MKINKILKSFALLTFLLLLSACGDAAEENNAPVISGAVDLTVEVGDTLDLLEGVTASDIEDGDLTASVTVNDDELDLDAEGSYTVTYQVTDSAGELVEVSVTITVNPKAELTDEDRVQEDLEAYQAWLEANPGSYDFIKRGEIHRSVVSWRSNSPYLSNEGVLLPLPYGMDAATATYTGTFVYRNASVSATFEVDLKPAEPVIIATSRSVPFENTTTEYDVADGNLTLYFEEDGYVPYVKVLDFFDLLEGFVDPDVDITVTTEGSVLTMFYIYYDEDEDESYDLELIIDADANTISTNDPGFYWAYIYSTETNFGRHIEYDYDNPNAHYYEGSDVVYDLTKYNLDIVVYEGEIVVPYYTVNQLFAGSSYYNVYYNNQKLYGIYGTPADDSEEYTSMKTSNMNGEEFPHDLAVHNFNVLAFNLDYFYGLMDLLEIDSFYELMYPLGSRLLSSDPATFELALRDLLLKDIDEPHTSYGYPGYFNEVSDDGPAVNTLSVYGSRFQNWYYDGYIDVDDAIGAKWGESTDGSWNAYSGLRPDYWFLDDAKTSVVITLNGFRTSDIEESAAFDHAIISDMLRSENMNILPDIVGSTKMFYYNQSDNDDRQVSMLVKGLDANYVAAYGAALETAGFTKVVEETVNQAKKDGYYSITVGDISYMVQLSFDEENALFYVGIANQLPTSYTADWPFEIDIEAMIEGDSAVYLEMVMDRVTAEAPNLVNAMLDLTWNTGGNVGALYRVVGFITSEPFMTARISGNTGGASSSYVYIDGVPVYDNLNWALLTSPLTFSAANSLATIFKMNDLGPIIGLTSGGGASSITPILLPSGTSFTMSSNSVGAVRTGSGTEEDPYVYENNEFGIEPDIVISIEEIYNEEILLTAFE
jgi:hypothetical protein